MCSKLLSSGLLKSCRMFFVSLFLVVLDKQVESHLVNILCGWLGCDGSR